MRPQAPGGLLLVFFLAACTMVGHERVHGWPPLDIVEHYLPHADMRERCARYTGFGMSPLACAEFRFAEGRCDIWYSADFPPSRALREHERLHCAGYDHIGSRGMQTFLEAWLASERAMAAAR